MIAQKDLEQALGTRHENRRGFRGNFLSGQYAPFVGNDRLRLRIGCIGAGTGRRNTHSLRNALHIRLRKRSFAFGLTAFGGQRCSRA